MTEQVTEQEKEHESTTIDGYQIDLSDDRSVWMARHPSKDNAFYLVFTTGDRETKIALSKEAIDAVNTLRAALTDQLDPVSRWVAAALSNAVFDHQWGAASSEAVSAADGPQP